MLTAEWVPVETQLPNINPLTNYSVDVLICRGPKRELWIGRLAAFYGTLPYPNDEVPHIYYNWSLKCRCPGRVDDVTHWAHLPATPAPPTEGTTE